MLHSFGELRGYDIVAKDGSMGDVHDLYFDDRFWVARYLVVDTGRWLPGRKVLIAPETASPPDSASGSVEVALTKEQVKESPGIAIDLPVSRQKELELRAHYDWPAYWDAYPAGLGAGPLLYPVPAEHAAERPKRQDVDGDPNLRSAHEVTGYHIAAEDGEIGHVEDLLVDPDGWVIRYVVVDTRNWLPGRKVLLAPGWMEQIDWAERLVHVAMDRKSVKESPPYDPSEPIDPAYEADLHRHYDKPVYWSP